MLKITTYIFRQLSLSMVFVALILTGAVWLAQSLRFVDFVLNKGLPLSTFLHLIIFLVPDLMGIVLPASLLVATLFVYNRLHVDHELTVMKATGMSEWNLSKPLLALALGVTAILFSITLYFLPVAFQQFRDMEHEIRNHASAAMLQEGEFNNFKGITAYIRDRKGPQHVMGIVLHNMQNPQKPYTVTAEEGSLLETSKGLRLVMLNGIRQEVDSKTGRPSMLYFDQYTVDLSSEALSVGDRQKKPYELFVTDLLNPDQKSKMSPQQIRKMQIEAHQRFIMPLFALVFSLVGGMIMLLGEYDRRHRFRRIFAAIGICCFLQLVSLGLLNFADRMVGGIYLAYGVVFLSIFIPFLSLRGKDFRIKDFFQIH